jgi:protein-S-isoprenylcysteine O-methyltransferase Ste14
MEHKIMPPAYFGILLLLSIGSHFVLPIKKVIQSPFTYLGVFLIVLGGVLNIWSDALFKTKKTTVKPYENPRVLETCGPFRISRHPMYLGMAMILLGLAILLGSLIMFLFPIVFTILMELIFIPFEEKNLERIFGEKYFHYRKRTRRWI